ncbi:MAG TPA: hypothetical protein VMD56_09705 [Steroidobacteraceae bacterium]|nr:hypothetical protein [Steroidobacteraceae bacterium]
MSPGRCANRRYQSVQTIEAIVTTPIMIGSCERSSNTARLRTSFYPRITTEKKREQARGYPRQNYHCHGVELALGVSHSAALRY